MKQDFFNFKMNTNGQKLYEFTDQAINWITKNNFKDGILNLNIQHTSASLIVQENADPDVQTDLINYFNKLAPMDSSLYTHTTEGKDDMPAHIKSSLTNNQITLIFLSNIFSNNLPNIIASTILVTWNSSKYKILTLLLKSLTKLITPFSLSLF